MVAVRTAPYFLQHFYVNRYTGGKGEVGERFYKARGGIDDVNEAFMHSHLKLLSRVFINERGTVDGVLLDFCRKGNRTFYRCVKAERRIENLLDGSVQNLVLIGTNANPEFRHYFGLCGFFNPWRAVRRCFCRSRSFCSLCDFFGCGFNSHKHYTNIRIMRIHELLRIKKSRTYAIGVIPVKLVPAEAENGNPWR